MKILFFADNFPPEKNAQASRVYERACYWIKWGHEVTVVTCAPNFPEGKVYPGYRNHWYRQEMLSGIRVVRVKTYITPNAGLRRRTLDYLSYVPGSVLAGLRAERPDVVVATSPHLFAAFAGWSLAAMRGLPFVMELSDLWPESIAAVGAMRKGFALRWIEKLELFLYAKAKGVIALTHSFKENLMERGVPGSKVSVVINGVDLGKFEPRPRDWELGAEFGLTPEHFVVGYLGTHGMAHALENVLDAAEAVTDPRIRFLFVGSGAERDLLVKSAQARRLKNVVFVGPQPKERMPGFWSLCDVALVHLKNTALFKMVIPSKIFEAMGMGLPVLLALPEGEASRIVRGEGAGLCVPPEKPKELAEAVQLLCENRLLLERLAEASLHAAPRYTRERQAQDFLVALERLRAFPAVEPAAVGVIKQEAGS
jgi:glycosyltransferase involved in cell wall biosynthesis